MSNSFISTDAIFSPARNSVMKIEIELARAQKEVSTGFYADIGLEIGGRTAGLDKMLRTQAWQDALTTSNGVSAARLDMSQTSLSSAVSTAQDFLNQVLAAKGSIASMTAISTTATHAIGAFTTQLNTEIGGVHVFGGDNSAAVPLASYTSSGSSASAAIASAFTGAFGMSQSSPGVSAITPAQMQAFLNGPFAAEFSAANWSANWSSASSTNPTMKISDYEKVEVGANANEQAFRDLAQAYVMVSDLGLDKLDPNTQQVVLDKASTMVSSAISNLATMQSRLGNSQSRISSSNDSLAAEGMLIANKIADIQQVDPYEASTTVNTLMTQLQASFAVTARLQQMNLVDYL